MIKTQAIKIATWLGSHIWHFVSGLVIALVGYFGPIQGAVAVMVASISLDFVIGLRVALKTGEAIQSRLMWRTVEKGLVCIALVMLLYAAYIELGTVKLHNCAAWVVVGFEIWSMLESLSKVKDNKIFRILRGLMSKNIEKQTGIKL